jgi:uncharacterized RDD family membrane protein YckC
MAAVIRAGVWGVLPVVLGAVPPVQGQVIPKPEIGLVGNDQILWLHTSFVGSDGARLVRIAYRSADSPIGERFFPQTIGPVTGRVAYAANRGLRLHVIFGDGSHWRYAPGTPRGSVFVPATRSPEISLIPGKSVLPSAVAGDEVRDCLYALVTAREAAEIHALRLAAINDDAGGLDDGGTEDPAVIAEPAPPPTGRAIVRYDGVAWSRDRLAPPDLPIDGRVVRMLAGGEVVHLIYQSTGEGAAWVHRRSVGPDEEWGAAAELPLVDPPTGSAAGWVAGEPVLLVGQKPEGVTTIRSLRVGGGAWVLAAELLDEGGGPARFSDPVSFALYGGEVAVATLNQDGDPQVGLWSLDTGALIEPFTVVAPLAQGSSSKGEPSPVARFVLQSFVLLAVLAAVFAWRRGSVARQAQLGPGLALAAIRRRVTALLIDLVIIAPLWALVLYVVFLDGGDGLTTAERLVLGMRRSSSGMSWLWAILGAIFAVYGTIFEAIIYATPGKRASGLFVVNEEGGPCGFGAIVVRNLVRVIEFHFPPILLLAIVTVNRQRLGDLFARTVVVELAEEPPAEETPDSSNDTGA